MSRTYQRPSFGDKIVVVDRECAHGLKIKHIGFFGADGYGKYSSRGSTDGVFTHYGEPVESKRLCVVFIPKNANDNWDPASGWDRLAVPMKDVFFDSSAVRSLDEQAREKELLAGLAQADALVVGYTYESEIEADVLKRLMATDTMKALMPNYREGHYLDEGKALSLLAVHLGVVPAVSVEEMREKDRAKRRARVLEDANKKRPREV